jgi:hypothetical protein
MEMLKRVHANNLVAWAKDKPKVLVLSADLTSSCEADLFRDTYPDRFFSMGIAEQNMLSFASGLAREGFMPLVHTFAVFIYRRAYDQVAMSVAYGNTPVKMFGFLPGITTPGGATRRFRVSRGSTRRQKTKSPHPDTGSKWKLVVPHERVEAYQGPTALSRNGSTGSPRTGGEGQIQPVFRNEVGILMRFFC